MLVLRDLQKQYTKFRLGYLWTLLEPLGMSLVLWFVFSVLLGARALGQQPYVLFLSLAILPWWWFTKGISASTRVFRRAGGQLRVSLLPTELWVVRVILVSMVEFVFSLPVIILAMVATQYWPGPLIVLYPVGILLQFMLMYGLALLVSAGSVVIPDLARIVRIVLRAMFYLSPIIYSIANIPAAAAAVRCAQPAGGRVRALPHRLLDRRARGRRPVRHLDRHQPRHPRPRHRRVPSPRAAHPQGGVTWPACP